jgi:hypothetical protein
MSRASSSAYSDAGSDSSSVRGGVTGTLALAFSSIAAFSVPLPLVALAAMDTYAAYGSALQPPPRQHVAAALARSAAALRAPEEEDDVIARRGGGGAFSKKAAVAAAPSGCFPMLRRRPRAVAPAHLAAAHAAGRTRAHDVEV